MTPEPEPRRSRPAPASLVPLPSFLRWSFGIEGPVPVSVESGFLLLTAYIGYVMADSFGREGLGARIAVGALVAGFSVFWHECGHAAAFLAFGGRPRIALVSTGGATTTGKTIDPAYWRGVIVSASGPLAGYLLYLLARTALRRGAPWDREGLLFFALVVALSVNWIWTLLNLVPALPLDGGNILRILLRRFFGPAGLRHAYRWSFGVCAALVAYALFRRDWLLAFFAYSLAAGNLKSFRNLSLFSDAELEPEAQRVISSVAALEKEEKFVEAYGLLLTLKPILGPKNACALAQLACRTGRYREAVEICEPLRAKRPKDHSLLFLLARAYAGLGDPAAAADRLKQAVAAGMSNAWESIEACPEFKGLKDDPGLRQALPPPPGPGVPGRDDRI